jgi:Photosynthesis system II assembly factor YCF48/Putative zinc-finger
VTELSKIVVNRLQTATNATHPDPDVITAFVEKSLGERERDQVLGHLAHCRDCREVVALSFPQHQASLPAAVSVRSPWLAWPVLRWGALAACVVVVGAAVTLHRQFRTSSPPEPSDIAKAPQEKLQTTSRSDTNDVLAPEAKGDLASAGKKAQLAGKESFKNFAAAAKTEKPLAPAPGPRDIPAPTEAVEVSGAAAVNPSASDAMDEAVPGRAKDALQPSAPGAAAVNRTMAARSTVTMAQSALMAKRALPAPVALSPRWTLSAEGTLQRSRDSGRTWEPIAVAGQPSFRALAADGLEIWVGGAKGALYHSSDAGQDWTQVQPAANGEVLTGDVTGVEFTDRLHGTVTTSGQEKWVTADAGQTWQKQ